VESGVPSASWFSSLTFPTPFGFYPQPPPMQYPHQPPMQFHGIGQGSSQQQHQNETRPRQNNQGFRPRGQQQRQRQDRQEEPNNTDAKGDYANTQPEDQAVGEQDKQPKVTSFNCGELGHFSTDCKAPRLCFICHIAAHVGRDC
jgi:hypothetical protein